MKHPRPRVRPADQMKDVLFEMTRKRLGLTTVVDADGRLVGLISDGDLRRWMEKTEKTGENLLAKKSGDIMTRNPKVANKDSLAAEAVAIMEKNSITCLIVADASFRPEGVIHLHDLLKAGVV